MNDPLKLLHPWFVPLWRKLTILGFCGAWAIFEFSSGAPFWGILVGGLASYCGYFWFGRGEK